MAELRVEHSEIKGISATACPKKLHHRFQQPGEGIKQQTVYGVRQLFPQEWQLLEELDVVTESLLVTKVGEKPRQHLQQEAWTRLLVLTQ